MMPSHSHPGYVFLISVLVVGAIVTLIVSVLLLLATTVQRSILSLEQASRTFSYAQSCTERALYALHADAEYEGNSTISFADGSCSIGEIGGIGTMDRHFCVTAVSSGITRIFEITVRTLLPTVQVRSWQEVSQCLSTP